MSTTEDGHPKPTFHRPTPSTEVYDHTPSGLGTPPTWLAPRGGGATATGYSTSLPTSPVDGQQSILVDSTTNPSYQWLFRYNAGSVSTYKWEFLGGTTLESIVDTFESITPGTTGNFDLATVGPSFTPVHSGEYIVSFGGQAVVYSGGALANYMNFTGGGQAALQAASTTGNTQASVSTRRRVTLTASTLYKCQYAASTTGVTISWSARWLSVLPARIS